jgi:gliding motility-associated protein GldM
MSLPKEPRQKMINMMYLVLTAMLALNVSAEILNAFKTVNNSINQSNGVITEKNNNTYNSLKEKLNDPQTKANANIWAPKAFAAQKLSSEVYSYIDELKTKLIEESGPYVEEGEKKYREDDLEAATRMMDKTGQGNGEGKKLYEALKAYRAQLVDILKPEEFADNALLQKDVANAKAEFAKNLPLDLTVPKSQTGNARTSDSARDWTDNYFNMTPSIAAMTILSKFQNDIKNSESQIVDYCHKKIGEVKIVFDQFQGIAQASSNYVMPGDKLTITAGVGAFSAAAKPKIYMDGQLQPLTADGTAEFNTVASSAGAKTINVKIEYNKPDGSPATIIKEVKYTVGLPSGASVFLEKMNVLYIGVDNPLSISAGSTGREKMHASFDKGTLTATGGDKYIAKPTTPGMGKIIVNISGKNSYFDMRVKYLPLPAGFIGAKRGGAINTAEFKAIGGLIARLQESDFEAPFKVVSYKLGAIGGSIPQYVEASNDGNKWGGQAASLVNRASPGTNIFFDEIRVIGPDGRTVQIPPMVFQLR